jgi:hypothetical protein
MRIFHIIHFRIGEEKRNQFEEIQYSSSFIRLFEKVKHPYRRFKDSITISNNLLNHSDISNAFIDNMLFIFHIT